MNGSINLIIDQSARMEIERVVEKARVQFRSGIIPAIMWIDSQMNGGLVTSGVAIGVYGDDDRRELGSDVKVIDGLECVLAIAEDDIDRFNNKTLVFDNGQMLLRPIPKH